MIVTEDQNSILSMNDINIDDNDFQIIFMSLFNIHAPIKQKDVRANNRPFMTKALRKFVIQRSKYKNSYNNDKCVMSKIAYEVVKQMH